MMPVAVCQHDHRVCVCVCLYVRVCVCVYATVRSQADADKLVSRLQHIVFKIKHWSCECPLLTRMWINLPCEDRDKLPMRLSILRAVRLATDGPVCLTITNLNITTLAIQALQDSLPGGLAYLSLRDCKWPVRKALLTKLGAAVPLGIKGVRISDKLSKADLLGFCTGLSERKGLYREVWVYCNEYKGPDVRVGEYVLLSAKVCADI